MIQRRLLYILLPLTAGMLAALACARSDVPRAGGVGSAGIPTVEQPTESPPSTIEITPTERPEPTVTPTPYEPEPLVSPTFPPTPTLEATNSTENVLYEAQAGDFLRAVAVRFGVVPEDIKSPDGPLPPEKTLINPGQLLVIPRRLGATGPSDKLIPDSELVFSPHAADFNIDNFVAEQGGYLTRYQETIGGKARSGAEVVGLAARDNSVNPRLLLAFLEYKSGWVTNPAKPVGNDFSYPLGKVDPQSPGLFRQLTWLANELGRGYYEWRAGTTTELQLHDGSFIRLAPDLNAGTVAIQSYFARELNGRDWAEAVSDFGLIETYRNLFGDPFAYSHPLYELGLVQPDLILPFLPNHIWAFTGGPHGAWEREAAWAALDFAPSSSISGCVDSDDWVVASAPGLVVRSENGVVVLDLDGDGREQTGWVLLYLHIAERGRIEEGSLVEKGDLLGHPSCEGGIATGTHLHFARKYNGEWILADGPLAFNLDGWVAVAGNKPYQGALVKDDQIILACPCASRETYISR